VKNRIGPGSVESLFWSLVVLSFTASMAMAGPNAGGVLVVHDTGLAYSSDTPGPPYGGPVPTSCYDVDVEAPFGDGANQRIWKVYAAFPAGSSPRLQGLAWGIDITPRGAGYVHITTGGMVNSADFEVTQDGWPTTNGASIGQSFPTSGTKTTLMTEVYWFAGYAYGGGSGTDAQYFCATTHSVQASVFVDDATIKNSDVISGYGCLGFGAPGHTHCPVTNGSCCAANGTCTLTTQAACVSGTWTADAICSPNPCPQPGRCCDNAGLCTLTLQAGCTGTWSTGSSCNPNPCPAPGACCNPTTGGCTMLVETACLTPNIWHTDWSTCSPNPCPQSTGNCCDNSTSPGTCSIVTQAACEQSGFTWLGATACSAQTCAGATGN
jgi:hypothetical protein